MTKCKKCGLDIGFKQAKSGKSYPVDRSGKPHWLTCEQSQNYDARVPVAPKAADWLKGLVKSHMRSIRGEGVA